MSAVGAVKLKKLKIVGVFGPGKGAITLRKLTISGSGGAYKSFRLTRLVIAGTGLAGTVRGSVVLTPWYIQGQGHQSDNAYGGIVLPSRFFSGRVGVGGGFSLPIFKLGGTGHCTSVAAGAIKLKHVWAYGAAKPGQQGAGTVLIPVLSLLGTGYPVPHGTGGVLLNEFVLEGYAFNEVGSAVPYRTVVVNTRHAAISEYLNFNFESFCEFPAGTFLAVDEAGNLYQLYNSTGTDDGDLINAELQFGTTDFNVDTKKNCVDGFINFRGDNSAEINVLVDEMQDPNSGEEMPDVYLIQGIADGRLRNYKFKMSRKREGKNWRFSVKNVNGSSLDINEVAVFYDVLSRRV